MPPFIKAGRTPLCYVGVNSVGMQRRGFTGEVVNEVLEIYRHIYNKGLNITQALDYLDKNLRDSEEKNSIVTFIKGSKKGIVKSSNKVEIDED